MGEALADLLSGVDPRISIPIFLLIIIGLGVFGYFQNSNDNLVMQNCKSVDTTRIIVREHGKDSPIYKITYLCKDSSYHYIEVTAK